MIDSTLTNFFFSRSEMVENNPNVPLAVEAMDEQAYASHLAGRHAAVATLSHTVVDYPGKKMLLEQAIKVEKDASDALRTLANVTITAGAANEELTIERRNAMMVRSRQNLFSARQLFLSVKSKLLMRIKILQFCFFYLASIFAGYDVAFEVLGGAGADDLLSPDQKKLLEAAFKRKRDDENSAAWAGGKRPASQYLSMALAGGKKLRRDRTNSPCHLCQ